MCGIVGFWWAETHCGFEAQKLLDQMNDTIVHRGPDEEGSFIEGTVGLANRRLSILDLEQGQQPIYNEDRSVVVIYNGEIYNYLDLRRKLELKGHRFTTQADTEVLVHLYEEYDSDLVSYLRGMFAFALYDRKRRKLMLACDPFGIKPLIYTELPEGFAFASEQRALLALPDFPRKVSDEAIALYAAYNYIPAPFSIWQAARRLEPGHLLIICDGKVVEKQRYFVLEPKPWHCQPEEAIEALDQALQNSVKAHLIADVPIGAFLSGGLDSSLICAIAQKALNQPLRTFTVTFPEWNEYDESLYARRVAKHLGTQHEEIPIKSYDALMALHEIVNHLDEPFADSSIVNVAIISRIMQQHVKVALSGDGGDEFFAGYNKYQGLQLAERLLVPPLPTILSGLARLPLSERRGSPLGEWVRQMRKLARLLHSDPFERYYMATLAAEPEVHHGLLSLDLNRSLNASCLQDIWKEAGERSFSGVNRWLWSDVHFVLPYDMLRKVDAASMRYSLEVRVPLVDVDVAHLAFSLPDEQKLHGFSRKWILKQVAARYLPAEVIHRRKKGFGIPLGEWLRKELRAEFEEVFSIECLSGSVWNVDAVQRLFKEHMNRDRDRYWELWNVYVFERWRRQWRVEL